MLPIFKTEMLIYRSNTNLDVMIMFGTISHLLDPEIRKMSVRDLYGNEKSTFDSGPWSTWH